MSVRSVSVNNVSLSASENDIKEFFSFSGEIECIDLRSETQRSQIAYVTFKDPQGAEKAVLLSGATIVDQSVTIDLAPDYNLGPSAPADHTETEKQNVGETPLAVQQAEDVVSGMLARGFTLGKDAFTKAKSFDEKHHFTSSASAKVASFDQKIGLTRRFSTGATIMNDKVKAVDQKLQVSEKTRTAFTAAQQTVSSAGSAIMKNRYLLTGTSWVVGAFSRVTKAAGEVGQKTKAKIAKEEGGKVADGSGQVPGTDSAEGASASLSLNEKSSGVTEAAGKVEQKTNERTAKEEGKKVADGSGQVPGTDSAEGASGSLPLNDNLSKVTKAAGEVGQKTKEKMTEEEGRKVADGSGGATSADSARGAYASLPPNENLSGVTKAAGEVEQKTKEKMGKEEARKVADGSGQVPGTDSTKGASGSLPLNNNSSRVTKAAGEVGQKTKEKMAEGERRKVADGSGQVPSTDSAKGSSASLPLRENLNSA